ncbi:MAG: hypothetical protein WAV38_38140 [Xanthobacteraceae bacterium]
MKQRAPAFHRHVRAHEAIVTNEFWYGDGSPVSLAIAMVGRKSGPIDRGGR